MTSSRVGLKLDFMFSRVARRSEGTFFASALAALLLLPASPLRGATADAMPAPFLLSDDPTAQALHPFLPPPDRSTGAAVVIIPGVPFSGSNNGNEGVQLARWLNARGIAGFVVGARLRSDPAASVTEVSRAVSLLRSRAAEFKLSPGRIALLGIGPGAELASAAGYTPAPDSSGRPDLLALINGGSAPAAVVAGSPPTFLVGSARITDGQAGLIELWTKLRAARSPVDAHFFAKAETNSSLGHWNEMFFKWVRFQGLLTDAPRVPIKGMVYLDGRSFPHGYVILTPIDFVGAGPIVARIFNSTANAPLGEFVVPASQGPVAGRYKVDVRQNMNRWLSNSFSGGLIGGRGGNVTPEQAHFGHHRVLAPSIADQRSFTKARPMDKEDLVIEIKPEADANLALKIEVFTGFAIGGGLVTGPKPDNIGGLMGGPKNPGQVAYVEQIWAGAAGTVKGIPEPILLWPNGAPGAVADASGVFTDEDKPALYAFPAPAANNTGVAFLILPGGGFTNRVTDTEGVQVAKFLNQHGIGGFVLRYRISPNYGRNSSTMDGQRAMRYIRANAAQFEVLPDRIGVIGFSAGGALQCDAFYNSVLPGDPNAAEPLDRVSSHADFSALIYGSRPVQNPAAAPPTFMFATVEDQGGSGGLIGVMNSLRTAAVPVEAHFYQVGPHGTTLSPGDPQLGQWPELMIKWLRGSGLTGATPPAARSR